MIAVTSRNEGNMATDQGKYVRYTPEQVEALERVYCECPKPSSLRRQQLIRECPILSNIEPKQIKVWFQNRRCREKQRKESSQLQTVNRKLMSMNKLLLEENTRLQKQVTQLVYDNSYLRQRTQNVALATMHTYCESVVTNFHHHLISQHKPRDSTPVGLMSIAEETLTEFLSKATGTTFEWIQMPGMKPGPDSVGTIAISHGCTGVVAARACAFVGLETTKVAEILKDRLSWCRDCRSLEANNVMLTANNETIEVLYMQVYAPTTLAPAQDFWLLRYTKILEDNSLVVCQRSVNSMQGGPSMPPMEHFVRAEMLPSGYLIRPCDDGGSMIYIIDHFDFQSSSMPEVIRPLYESSTRLAQSTTITALHHLRQISYESSYPTTFTPWGRQPAALRALSHRLSRGFNEAVNGFPDDGWSIIPNDVVDDVTVLLNSSPRKMMTLNLGNTDGSSSSSSSVLCATASILLQNISPPVLLSYLREHRSEWADSDIDAYSAAAVKAAPRTSAASDCGSSVGPVILTPVPTLCHEEYLEVVKLEGICYHQETLFPCQLYLLQLCNGLNNNSTGTCSELIFAPVDASCADDAPLLPSGFRVISLDSDMDTSTPNRTLDLASAIGVESMGIQASDEYSHNCGSGGKSVMTIAFQFAFENHHIERVVSMARQYIHNIKASVKKLALILSPSHLGSHDNLCMPHGSTEGDTLARCISESYRVYSGSELLESSTDGSDSLLKMLWHHSNAILCCTTTAIPVLTFANKAGLEMLQTTLVDLQNTTLESIFMEEGRKAICREFPHTIQQGFVCLQGGLCVSSNGRSISYEKVIAWKVLDEGGNAQCTCFMFVNWCHIV
ncbi:homeobox-leucine zipper protein ATHB-15-like isoform X2 [Zingiber officinale]|uniref:homeobox-leucine zipper protein ATHB-15-like isoform X2 n=1 Tax=Zingiber officinale TaxID=94328 RepID=UPI001C4A9618|nr:homeobox-leucine zipper protein ATHB-15-like isoform X2 [Zingiber officinale]